jgi:hypothetical protein
MVLAVIVSALAWPSAVRGQGDVLPGWVLFNTLPTSTFDGVNWQGVPLGTFNFGSHGSQSVGAIDTIIQIQDPITSSGPIEVVGVQLRTVNQVSLGGGPLGYYYITLNTYQPSSGTLTIDSFPTLSTPGFFDTSFSVYFDVRYGSLNGPIVALDQTLSLSVTSQPWERNAPPGVLELPGINYLLNGTDTSDDFWPGVGPDGARVLPFVDPSDPEKEHDVIVPEPTTGLLAALGTGLWLMRRKLLRK